MIVKRLTSSRLGLLGLQNMDFRMWTIAILDFRMSSIAIRVNRSRFRTFWRLCFRKLSYPKTRSAIQVIESPINWASVDSDCSKVGWGQSESSFCNLGQSKSFYFRAPGTQKLTFECQFCNARSFCGTRSRTLGFRQTKSWIAQNRLIFRLGLQAWL